MAILLTGNIQFKGSDKATIDPASNDNLAHAAKMLGIPVDDLTQCLTKQTAKMGRSPPAEYPEIAHLQREFSRHFSNHVSRHFSNHVRLGPRSSVRSYAEARYAVDSR